MNAKTIWLIFFRKATRINEIKFNLIKISQLIIMVLTISTLLGCYNKEEFKQKIKDGFDKFTLAPNLKVIFATM